MTSSPKNIDKELTENFYKKTLRPDRQKSYKLIAKFIKRIQWTFIESAIDYGCGVGWMLHYLNDYGVTNVCGIEPNKEAESVRDMETTLDKGKVIKMTQFVKDSITSRSLKRKINLKEAHYDMAICLEVAEHLEEKYADLVVENITKHTDLVIFSSAHPGQGGYGHVNEQALSYWEDKFIAVGFNCNHDATQKFRTYLSSKGAKKWYSDNIAVFEKS